MEKTSKSGSESRSARSRQKERVEGAFNKRKALLEEKGVAGKEIYKDTLLRKLKADLRKANRRLAAIDAIETRAEKPAEKGQKEISGKSKKKAGASAKGKKAKKS